MRNQLAIPPAIEIKLEELYNLVEQYPLYIPVPVAANFLGMKADGLRNSLDKGQCPFGVGWQMTLKGNKAYKIPTVTFYLWYTQGVGFRGE